VRRGPRTPRVVSFPSRRRSAASGPHVRPYHPV